MKTTFLSLMLATSLACLFSACNTNNESFDASGSFETDEIVISSEVGGVLLQFTVQEGLHVSKGGFLGCIDSTQLYLKKMQLLAQIKAIASKKPDTGKQIAALEAQLENVQREYKRMQSLYAGGAATQKQVDDLRSQTEVLQKQEAALQSTLEINSGSIDRETGPVMAQVAQLDDQIKKCRLYAPISGTILASYANPYETAMPGKPLYKIGSLDTMTLRTYITGDQLAQVKLNQLVQVFTDNGNGGFSQTPGNITWISSQAEFTPKTIQTKDERASMVYAIKVRVANKGLFKIGMYGEIRFQ